MPGPPAGVPPDIIIPLQPQGTVTSSDFNISLTAFESSPG
jgi:hypothetical protein